MTQARDPLLRRRFALEILENPGAQGPPVGHETLVLLLEHLATSLVHQRDGVDPHVLSAALERRLEEVHRALKIADEMLVAAGPQFLEDLQAPDGHLHPLKRRFGRLGERILHCALPPALLLLRSLPKRHGGTAPP